MSPLAVTVCQPYAELIARGDKPIENRTWATRYRGPLLIHAGRSRAWLSGYDREDYGVSPEQMAFGAFVAVADLVACLSAIYPADTYTWPARWRHLSDHEHANGPYCWVLERVRRLSRPVPCRGAQGLWTAPTKLLAEIVPEASEEAPSNQEEE